MLGDHIVIKMYLDMDKYRSQALRVAWLKLFCTDGSDTAADSKKRLRIPVLF